MEVGKSFIITNFILDDKVREIYFKNWRIIELWQTSAGLNSSSENFKLIIKSGQTKVLHMLT